MIKLLVFDWDGTLMDSAATIVEAMSAAYRDIALTPPPRAAIRHIIGLSFDDALARLSPNLDSAAHNAIITGYRRNYAAIADTPLLFPGVAETLEALAAAGFLLAVATGKSRAGLARALAQTGLDALFVTSRTGEESEPKPSPAMLYEILGDLDVDAAAACMLGDTAFDLAMARAAGMHAGAVTYGAHAPAQLLRHQPAFMLDNFAELPQHIDRLMSAQAAQNLPA